MSGGVDVASVLVACDRRCNAQHGYVNKDTRTDANTHTCRAQWLRGRPSDSRLREPGFESCAPVLKPWARFFHSTLLQFTQLYK